MKSKLAFVLALISVLIEVAIWPPAGMHEVLAKIVLLIPLTIIFTLVIEAWMIIVLDRGRR